MRLSKLFGKTLREAPSTASRTAEQLAMRAALMRNTIAGFSFMPLGFKALSTIKQLITQDLQGLDGQEADLYFNRDALSAYQSDIGSYRDLPRFVYWHETTTSVMAAYMQTATDFENGFRNVYQALVKAMQRCGLSLSAVEAGAGATRFVVPHAQGDQNLLICTSNACGYCSVADLAEFKIPEDVRDETRPLTKVETPHSPTIAALAEFLKVETRQTLKAVMYVTRKQEFIFAVIRGDLEVSETKLQKILGIPISRPATEAEIAATGAVPGYASPAGLKVAATAKERGKGKVTVVADHSIEMGSNFVAGANVAGYHLLNVNYPRDFQVTLMGDIAQAQAGSACAQCGQPLRSEKAFRLGGCDIEDATGLTYLSNAGRPEPVWSGYFWLNTKAILLSILDQHHDEAGIIWPKAIAPYDVHLIRLGKGPETLEMADRLCAELEAAGKTVLYDDRDEASPGVKFADADLIGLPVRVTVSDKGLKAGTVEVKGRESADKQVVPLAEAVKAILKL